MSWKVRGKIKTKNEGHVNIYQASIFEDQNTHPAQIIADDLINPVQKWRGPSMKFRPTLRTSR